MKNKLSILATAIGLTAVSLAPMAASAAGTAVDVTDTVSTIGLQLAPIGLVGVACLGVYVAVKAFHWVRRALA